MLEAIATLTGTIIGAGILGLPYAISKSGFLPGLFWMFVVYLTILLIHLMIGEITLRNKELHQLPGYAKKYTGKIGYFLMLFSTLIGTYGAIIAYLLAQSESLSILLGMDKRFFMVILISVVSLLLFFGINIIKYIEEGINLLNYSILIGVPLFLLSVLKVDFSRILYVNFKYFFYPIGAIAFAFIGFAAIPEVREILYGREKIMKKVIIIGTTIPLLLYVFFVASMLLTLKYIPEKATYAFGYFGYLLTIFLTFPPFITLSFAIKSIYQYDLGIKRNMSLFLTVFPPLLTALIVSDISEIFIKVISISGTFSLILSYPLILAIHRKSQEVFERKPEYSLKIPKPVYVLLFFILVLASYYELLRI